MMESVSNVTVHPCEDSKYIRPVRLRYQQNGVPKVWDAMKSHDSVCVLIYNTTRQVLVLVKQFRPAVYLSLSTEREEGGVKKIDTNQFPGSLGVSYELCAGLIDSQDSPQETAKKEVLEECGYDVPIENFERVTSYRSGVGISGAKQTLFYAEVTDEMKVGDGGGLAEEGELIEVIELSLTQARGLMMDEAKTKPVGLMFALMWFFDK